VFTEDLDAFFDDDDHAVSATYNGATTVYVIFDTDHRLTHDMVSTSNPVALGKGSDFPVAGAPVGKTLLINSVTYTIRDRRPMDDGAIVILELEKN
jgi:hypothetical protein